MLREYTGDTGASRAGGKTQPIGQSLSGRARPSRHCKSLHSHYVWILVSSEHSGAVFFSNLHILWASGWNPYS